MPTLTQSIVDIAECKTVIRRAGRGPTLLCLHGAGGAEGFVPMAERLAERFDVILPDHPGFGGSDLPAWLDNIHDAAYFYLDLMEALDLREIHLIGASLGGWLAMEIAVRSTERLRSLILCGAAGLNCKDAQRGDIFLWDPTQRIRNMVADPALAERMLAQKPSEAQAMAAIKNEFAAARLAWEPRFLDPNLHKWLHRIDVPTQIIWGDSDKVFPLPFGEQLQRLIPGATLTVIPKCGHLPHIEHPDRYQSIITTFASGLGGRGAAA